MTTTSTTAASAVVSIRALPVGDTDTAHQVFAQLSARSAFLRFHTGLPRLSPMMARRLAAVEPGQHEVLVAEHEGRPVGLARWIRDVGDPTVVQCRPGPGVSTNCQRLDITWRSSATYDGPRTRWAPPTRRQAGHPTSPSRGAPSSYAAGL